MRKRIAALVIFVFSIAFLVSCHKHVSDDPCAKIKVEKLEAFVGEMVGDTAFQTDTAYTGTVQFSIEELFKQIAWKIGEDDQIFFSQKFTLRFPDPVPLVAVNVTATTAPPPWCAANPAITDSATTTVTILPRDGTAKNPLVGTYLGHVANRPLDTFSVQIQFWNDPKYHPYLGPQPFYTVSNFPKGFRDTTSSIGTRFPELSYGYLCDWGFRALHVNEDYLEAQHVKGYAYLQGMDTLVIDYTKADLAAPFNSNTGYPRIKEKFIGVRKK